MNRGLGRYFKYVDRRIVTVLAAVVVALVLLNLTWVRSVNGSLAAAEEREQAATKDVEALSDRLGAIRSAGVATGPALRERVAGLERMLPARIDDLALTQLVVAAAQSSGASVDVFQPVKDAAAPTVAGASAATYAYEVSGPYRSVLTFLEKVIASRDFVATVDAASFASKSDQTGVFAADVVVTGRMSFWFASTPSLTGAGPAKAPATTAPPVTLPPAGDPAATTTVPPVVDPAATTTTPTTAPTTTSPQRPRGAPTTTLP